MVEHGVLINLDLVVIDSNNDSLIGISGKILEETKNSFTIETEKKQKKIIKSACTFIINGERVVGTKIMFRPHERLMQKWKRK